MKNYNISAIEVTVPKREDALTVSSITVCNSGDGYLDPTDSMRFLGING